jgi:hypothetical protein
MQLPAEWRKAAEDPNYTPSAYMPDRYRANALRQCAATLEAALAPNPGGTAVTVIVSSLARAVAEGSGEQIQPSSGPV